MELRHNGGGWQLFGILSRGGVRHDCRWYEMHIRFVLRIYADAELVTTIVENQAQTTYKWDVYYK